MPMYASELCPCAASLLGKGYDLYLKKVEILSPKDA